MWEEKLLTYFLKKEKKYVKTKMFPESGLVLINN